MSSLPFAAAMVLHIADPVRSLGIEDDRKATNGNLTDTASCWRAGNTRQRNLAVALGQALNADGKLYFDGTGIVNGAADCSSCRWSVDRRRPSLQYRMQFNRLGLRERLLTFAGLPAAGYVANLL